jgi:23S rRNA (uracil1939-C5)-methyltransferase
MSEQVTVKCLALAHGGEMVCEVIAGAEDLIKKKGFIAGLIPGEEALIKVTANKKAFISGELIQIQKADPKRIEPPCPYFVACGGCDLQYMPIEIQRQLKREMFESTLSRQAGLSLDGGVELIGVDLPSYGYRRRISLHINNSGEVGFYRPGTGEVVAINHCLISSEALNKTLTQIIKVSKELAPMVAGVAIEEFEGIGVPIFQLRDGHDKSIDNLEKFLEDNFPYGKLFNRREVVFLWHQSLSDEKQAQFATLNHFSQVNEQGNKLLIDYVLKQFESQFDLTEFYAGAGNFSFPLARLGKTVDAIEVDKHLVAWGSECAENEGLNNLNFIAESTERYLSNFAGSIHQNVLLDPPRSGARVLAETLEPERVKKIVYVSCALPTLARDLAQLVSRGYTLKSVAVLDMFSQTHHTESVSVLEA